MSRRKSDLKTNAIIPAASCFRDLDDEFSKEPCGGNLFAKMGRPLQSSEGHTCSAKKGHAH